MSGAYRVNTNVWPLSYVFNLTAKADSPFSPPSVHVCGKATKEESCICFIWSTKHSVCKMFFRTLNTLNYFSAEKLQKSIFFFLERPQLVVKCSSKLKTIRCMAVKEEKKTKNVMLSLDLVKWKCFYLLFVSFFDLFEKRSIFPTWQRISPNRIY